VRSALVSLLLFASLAMSANGLKVTPLSAKDAERLASQRAIAEKYLADERSKQIYRTVAGKLGLLRALIDRRVFKPGQTYELQSMGVVLGDAFVQELGLEWIVVEDSHGRDPAVRVPETSIILFPLTMISKRIEKGETVDVFDLFNRVAHEVAALRKQSVQ
jgi:hypothetical protein